MLTLTPDLIELLEGAGNHRKTLQAYLGPLPVLRRDQYGAAELEAISDAELFVAQGPGPMTCRRLEMPGLIGIDAFAVGGGGQNLLLSEKGVRVGGIFQLLPFVPPAHRGRGLGALMVLISDLNGDRFLFPESYSEEGFRARCAAHRTQVRLALEAGLPVPEEVLAPYRSRTPWSAEDQIRSAASWADGDPDPGSAPTLTF